MMFKPTEHEVKVMAYLRKKGPQERRVILSECASDNSLIGYRRQSGRGRAYMGSNGAAPMIVARWMKRLIAEGFVKETRTGWNDGWHHMDFRLTKGGQDFLRAFTDPPASDTRSASPPPSPRTRDT